MPLGGRFVPGRRARILVPALNRLADRNPGKGVASRFAYCQDVFTEIDVRSWSGHDRLILEAERRWFAISWLRGLFLRVCVGAATSGDGVGIVEWIHVHMYL
jgi:hypothetical protein